MRAARILAVLTVLTSAAVTSVILATTAMAYNPCPSGQLWFFWESATPHTPLASTGPCRPSVSSTLPSNFATVVQPLAPEGAIASFLNLTMVDGVAPGYITASSCASFEGPAPQVRSSGNHGVGTAIANLGLVDLSAGTPGGSVPVGCLYNQQALNIVVDDQGYVGPPGLEFFGSTATRLVPTPQRRLFDSRTIGTRLAAGTTTRVTTGIGSDATAVLVNIVMTDGLQPGYVSADRCDNPLPPAHRTSSGNHAVQTAIANLSIVPVSANGDICIYNLAPVHLAVDLQASFAPPPSAGSLGVGTVGSARRLDTRLSRSSPVPAGSITTVETQAAAGTSAVLANLTMVDGVSPGYITAGRCDQLTAAPQAYSSGNHGTTAAIANLAVVSVDAAGRFCVFNQSAVHLVVDIQAELSLDATTLVYIHDSVRAMDTRVPDQR